MDVLFAGATPTALICLVYWLALLSVADKLHLHTLNNTVHLQMVVSTPLVGNSRQPKG